MIISKPYSKIDNFKKADRAFDTLFSSIMDIGGENFKNNLPWDRVDKP